MKTKQNKLICIVVPLYNEAQNLPILYKKLLKYTVPLPYDFNYIFVNDGSTDESQNVLQKLSKNDEQIKIIEFSRNFGKEIATTAGLNASKGSAAIMIDADMQHPVKLIPKFIDKWEAGVEVVVGVRKSNSKEHFYKRLNSWLFYKIMNVIAEIKIVPNSTDYRLLDRVVIDAFNQFTERKRMTRGLIDWLGFKRDYIYFTANKRANGKATYNFAKMIRLSINSVVGLSLFPLRLAGWLGIIITALASIAGTFILVEQFILNDPLNLHISNMIIFTDINMILIGIVLVCLGLIALYIANIHSEVTGRPIYIVRKN